MNAEKAEYEPVTITVSNCQALQTKTVFAFVDVEIVIAGVAFWIKGVQARHLAGGGTSIHLPTYRTPAGVWRSAVELPAELVEALSDTILEYLVNEGVAVRKAG